MGQTMKMSDQGFAELAGHEAIVTSRYKDSVGVWTIGVGHTAAAGPPDPSKPCDRMDVYQALLLFRHDLARYEAEVNAAVKVLLTQPQFDALVSFHYNTGAIRRASLTKALNAGDYAEAGRLFMNWTKPAAVKARRQKEQKLFREGVYSNGGRATVYPASDAGAVQWSKGVQIDVLRSLRMIPESGPGLPAPAAIAAPPAVALPAAPTELTRKVQQLLRDRGYPEVGNVDGKMGARTRNAILAFQADNALELTGAISDGLLADLVKAPQRPVSEERATATAKDLKDAPAVKAGDTLGKLGGAIIAVSGVGGLLDGSGDIGDVIAGVGKIRALWETLAALSPWLLTAAGGVAAIVIARHVIADQVAKYRAGNHV
ncbi:glycoside hydrolase family protein [Aurantimonas sp. MSK8Z-1]|uniref:glycoside hydrolase family protein n=1 Tax=Mangrovibrevibacter kandeliae TaxID=2968473 RepID=UPI002118143A|nr:glycoside hydrolase family protein [Aurantimonas sp. MSK8Z-1]MCW4115660.1 glycoside hydrolase family protein [Aurantimonas sp. MSK8Z-1]